MAENNKEILLDVQGLKKYFKTGHDAYLHAVDDVSFQVRRGETLGIVGESGCGKTTCGRCCIGLYDRTDGLVTYKGCDVHKMSGSERKAFTKDVQIIFQDPYSSLDPKMKVQQIILEGMKAHGLLENGVDKKQVVADLLTTVGLDPSYAERFVHEFSGGQRQRIGIARALAVNPEFIVCDEPISALDVSIQAQIVNLLEKLQKEKGLTYMFIAHDLAMVRHISDRIMVMYLGKVMEIADSDALYERTMHPYTQALISAIPIPDPRVEAKKERIRLEGEIPSPINPKEGCRFCTRCKYADELCKAVTPELREVEEGHFVACHKAGL